MAKRSALELLDDYHQGLMFSLPMKDTHFMKELFKHNLLPEDTKHKLKELPDRKDRASYFLDNVIKAGLAVNDKKCFANLLTVMNNSKYDNVKDLAKQIKSKYDVDARSASPDYGSVLAKEVQMWELIKIVIPKTKGYWKELAYCMRYSAGEVEIFNREGKDLHECCEKLFVNWLTTSHGPEPKTYETLLNHIKKIDDLTAESEVIEKELTKEHVMDASGSAIHAISDTDSSSIMQDLSHSPSHESPPAKRRKYDRSDESLSRCEQYFKQLYIQNRFNIEWQLLHPKHFVDVLFKNPMECSKEKEIFDVATIMRHDLTSKRDDILTGDIGDNNYTPGLLEYFATSSKPEESCKSNNLNKISDIFKNSNGSRYILIEGAPGMGKTTLCKEIAYQWSDQHLLEDTKLLFLLHLRDPAISRIKQLKYLVHYFYNFKDDDTELSEQCAGIINERDGEDVTILFDGYDEFDSANNSFITNILKRMTLPQCRIVVTSCLTVSHKLHRMAGVRVEVLGFNNESRIQYIKQELKDDLDKITKLQSYLENHESIKSICCIPIMMTILVYMFKENRQLPKKSIKLYDKFVALTISHYLRKQKKLDKLFVSLKAFPKECKKFVFSLSKFAFLTLQTKKTVFNNEDIDKLCPDLTLSSYDIDKLDIINSVQYFSIDKSNRHFLHLSIHEYLAAYYINSIDQCRQFNELKSTFFNEIFQGTWTMFMDMKTKTCLKFHNFSVYCKDNLKEWITDIKSLSLFDCVIQLYDVVNSKIMSSDITQILFSKDENSAGDENNAGIASQQHFYLSLCSAEKTELELFIIDRAIKDVLTSDWFMLCITLLNNGYSTIFYTRHILILNKVNHQQMVDIFRYNISIEYIGLNYCHISEITADAINLSHFKNFLYFKVFNCSFEYNALIKLGEILSNFNTLSGIRIHSCHFTTQQVGTICSIISKNQNLKILELNNLDLRNDIFQIAETLKHTTTLIELILANNNIPQSAAAAISNIINLNKSLRVFNIEGNQFKSSVEEILKSLCRISSLQKLNLNSNEIPMDGSKALASIILHNKGLEELHLSDNNLGERFFKVAEALQCITSLKILALEDNVIPKEFFSQLAPALKSNKCLEKLWLSNNNMQSSAVVILQSLRTISTLKSLNINDNKISKEAGEALASVVRNNKGLEEIHLSGNNLGEGLLEVMKTLQHVTSLRILSLGNNNISKEVSNELASAITENKHLEEVGLFASNLKSSAVIILQSLSTISTLKILNINNNQITEEACEALASVILNNTRLEELHLSDNNLDEGTLKVTKALQKITSLRSLDFGNSNISRAAAGDLALAIESNKCLEKVWLHDNYLHSSAFVILQSLSNISSLKFLDINNNQIGEAGGEVLASVIKNNTGLRELHVRHNNIQNSVIKISEALQFTKTIDALDLGNNNFPERPCVKLAASNSSLTELQSYNNSQSSLVIMLKALIFTTKLRILNLYGNVIKEEAGNLLASLISQNNNLQLLSLNLLTSPLKVTEALRNLSSLEILVFDTCNLSKKAKMNIASAITSNKSLRRLSLENINLSQDCIQSIFTISNLTSLRLGNSLLSEEMCDDLSLAISWNTSLQTLLLLDNMLQAGLIKIAKACNKLSKIRVLQLAHNCIAPSKVVELTSIITQNTSLETVLLGGITLKAAEAFHYNINEVLNKTNVINYCNDTYIKSYDDHCTCLEVIYLDLLRLKIDNGKKCLNNVPIYFNAKNFCFAQKVDYYFGNNNITHIELQEAKQKLAQIDAKKIILSLYIFKKVKVIDLENNNIDEVASFELATALHSNNVLEQLWLRGNKLNTAGALCILLSLRYLKTLQVLDMSYNNIGSQSADGIAAVIDNNPLINQLWLDGNDLHCTGTITICNALKKIRALGILSLCNNGISDNAADELSAVITQNVLLEDLLLSNNQLHSTGIKIIAESLSKLIKLRKLDLFNNNIGKEGASSLAIVIQNSTSLQDLFLSGNNLETSGALEICNALSHIKSLHVLTLSNNNISDEITSQLIEVLNNNHLYTLLIGGNGLECGGLKIAQVIENDNIAMQLLDFSNNNISEQDKEEIKVVFSKRSNFKLYV